MIAKHVFYSGRVQGVGFRYTVKQIARGYDVTGWVRNLDDGRVEMLAAGETEEATAFLEEIRESTLAGHITDVESTTVPIPDGLRGFEIRS